MIFKSDVFFVFILIKYVLANAATIEHMFVPEVVQSGSIEVALCCQYSFLGNDSVHWLFNGYEVPERWNISIKNSDIMGSQGRFNSNASVMKQSLLSFQRVTIEMSGNYTCEVHSDGATVQQTKRMSVFSPENDFTLKINYPKHRTVDVDCTAWGLYPTPEITLEINNKPVSKQIQRVWWTEDTAFRAEGSASIRDLAAGTHEVTCRLYLPLADYTAIMKKFVNIDNAMCCGSHSTVSSAAILVSTTFVWLASRSLV